MTQEQLWMLYDRVLMGLHLAIIIINVFGWILPYTRFLQRRVLALTAISWLGLGSFYGMGYCFLTHWHWLVKMKLQEANLPHSFIQYLLRNKLGLDFDDIWVDAGTASVFALLLVVTLLQLYREQKVKNRWRLR